VIPGHRCSAWCTGGVHVDLAYFDGNVWTADEVAGRWVAQYGRDGVRIEVDRIELASEAPDRPHLDGASHLVWWRLLEAERRGPGWQRAGWRLRVCPASLSAVANCHTSKCCRDSGGCPKSADLRNPDT